MFRVKQILELIELLEGLCEARFHCMTLAPAEVSPQDRTSRRLHLLPGLIISSLANFVDSSIQSALSDRKCNRQTPLRPTNMLRTRRSALLRGGCTHAFQFASRVPGFS